MKVIIGFKTKNYVFQCLEISPPILAIVQTFCKIIVFYKHLFLLHCVNYDGLQNFDAQNLLFICLQISPQIFAIVQNFAMDNLRDQQFCVLLCEL